VITVVVSCDGATFLELASNNKKIIDTTAGMTKNVLALNCQNPRSFRRYAILH
jgi:hypothetical protein